MLTYKEFRKKLLTELEQRGIKFEITSMTSVNGEKERISIAFSNFTTDNAVDSDHKPETFGLYPDHEYANYLGLRFKCKQNAQNGKIASPSETILDMLGITIRECTYGENQQILKHLGKESQKYFKRAFRVQNIQTERRFYEWMSENGYTKKDIHCYFHGSKNQNYLGLLSEGPLLNPDAPITGKMFGYGIYLAPRAKKSINYTDISGSVWAKGKKHRAYLAVYKTASVKPKKKVNTDPNDVSAILYQKLLRYSRHVVETNLVDQTVTFEQIKMSRKYFNAMGQRKTVKGFNNQLMKLLTVCPRKARYVDELLANSTGDFAYIMQREENLIQAMEAVATASTNPHQTDTFADIGVEVYYANEKQKAQVLRHLNDQLIPKVKNIYRVIPGKQQKRFNKYIQEKGIHNVRQLWHGSRNENWLSIAKNGLLLNPNAVITGKMFGNGIYFATSSMKSWNYTSYRGTTWAGGTDDVGFMGLYAVAYGTPYDSHYHLIPFNDQKIREAWL